MKTFKQIREEFKPHWMYDPKTGEKEWAKVEADHERMKKKGWVHEKPVTEEYISEKASAFDTMFPGLSDIISKVKKPNSYKAAIVTYKDLVDKNAAPTRAAIVGKVSRMYGGLEPRTLGKLISDMIKKKKLDAKYAF